MDAARETTDLDTLRMASLALRPSSVKSSGSSSDSLSGTVAAAVTAAAAAAEGESEKLIKLSSPSEPRS